MNALSINDNDAAEAEAGETSAGFGGGGGRKKTKKSLGIASLVALIFFEVAGTPAGAENAVVAAGPRYALLGFLLMPLVWSVPEALFTAELSSMFPEDAGFVQWVSAAFGERWGYIEGGVSWLSTVLDAAIYPVMIKNYILEGNLWPGLEHSTTAQNVFMIVMVVLMSSLNYFGLKLVGWTAVGLVVMCLLPFIAFIIVGTPLVDTRKWYQTKPVEEIDVGLYLNTLFWNLNYFDSASTLAGEVENPTRTFPRALAMAVVLVVVVYLWPLAVAIGVSENVQFDLGFAGMNCTTGSPLHVLLTDETNTTWADSLCAQAKQVIVMAGREVPMPYTASGAAMLNNMTDDLSSSCTGGCNVISAFCPTCPAWVLGNISETLMSGGPSGPFDVNIAGTVYSLTSASGNTDATAHWNDAMYANLGGKVGGEWLKIWIVISITIACVGMYEADLSAGAYQLLGMAERGMIPSIFAKRSHFGTPTWGIVLASCVAWLCVIFDLESLIEMLNISYVLAAVLEIAAFLHLRYYRPDLPRPVKIPLGNVAVTLMLLPTVAFSIIVFCYADWQSMVFTVGSAIISIALSLGMANLRDAKPQWFIKIREDTSIEMVSNSNNRVAGCSPASDGKQGFLHDYDDDDGVYDDDDDATSEDLIDAPLLPPSGSKDD